MNASYYPAGTIQRVNLFDFKTENLYDLIYRGQIIITNAPYPVCNGKKSELIKAGYGKIHFTIKKHQA